MYVYSSQIYHLRRIWKLWERIHLELRRHLYLPWCLHRWEVWKGSITLEFILQKLWCLEFSKIVMTEMKHLTRIWMAACAHWNHQLHLKHNSGNKFMCVPIGTHWYLHTCTHRIEFAMYNDTCLLPFFYNIRQYCLLIPAIRLSLPDYNKL